MDKTEAEACWNALAEKTGEADARSWGEQFVELTRVLRKGSALEKAQALQRLYRTKAPPETHELMIARYEEALFPELAKALKKKQAALKAELHRGQPAFGREAPYRELNPLPEVPKTLLREWKEGDGFWVFGGKLCLAEFPTGDDGGVALDDGSTQALILPALDGAWLVLHRTFEEPADDDDDEPYEMEEWVAVHADHVARTTELVADAKPLGRVFCEGAVTAAIDFEMVEDRAYRRDFDAGEAKSRAMIVRQGGDGTIEWRGVYAGGSLCLVRVRSDLTSD